MNTADMKRERLFCAVAIGMVTLCYAVERLLEVFSDVDGSTACALAGIFTVVTAVIIAVCARSRNAFYGMLVALVGYKMMPPTIPALNTLATGSSILYYIAQNASIALFIVVLIKLYKEQKENKISLIPALACALVVPFFVQMGNTVGGYLMMYMNQNMLYLYFSQFAFYSLAMLIIFVVAVKSDYNSFRFVACYEFIALTINILRKLGVIGVYAVKGTHISKSFYCWIAIYVFFVALYAITLQKQKKGKSINE